MEREKHIVCIGDSITAGGDDGAKLGGWPGRLSARLNRIFAVAVHNLGVPAFRTIDVTEKQLPDVAQHAPDLLIIAVGVNDARSTTVPPSVPHRPERTPGQYRADVADLLTKAKALCPNTLVVTPMPVDEQKLGTPSRWPEQAVKDYTDILIEECRARNIACLDLHSGLPAAVAPRSYREFLRDGLHPFAEGYDVMAKLIESAAKPLLKP